MRSLKSLLAKPFAFIVKKSILKWANAPGETQNKVFQNLITHAANSQFGKDHDFKSIHSHADFVSRFPMRD